MGVGGWGGGAPSRPPLPGQEAAECSQFGDPSLRFRTGWLGVREAASASGSSLSLGLTQLCPAACETSIWPMGRPLCCPCPRPLSPCQSPAVRKPRLERPSGLTAGPGVSLLGPHLLQLFVYLPFHTFNRVYRAPTVWWVPCRALTTQHWTKTHTTLPSGGSHLMCQPLNKVARQAPGPPPSGGAAEKARSYSASAVSLIGRVSLSTLLRLSEPCLILHLAAGVDRPLP